MSVHAGRMRVSLLVVVLLLVGWQHGPAPTQAAHQCVCGVRRAQNETIYPSVPIEPDEWPWHTLVYYWPGPKMYSPARVCEGALIDDRFVLAPAHCLAAVPGVHQGKLLPADQLVVHVGVVAVQQDHDHSRRYRVRNVTVEEGSSLALIELVLVQVFMVGLPADSGEGSGAEVPELGWKPTPVCLVDALDLTTLYGTEMYILSQSQRNWLGGYKPVRLVLDEFLLCSGSTLAMKARSINGTTISFTINDRNLLNHDRGTALYFKHQGSWSLLGFTVARTTHQWTPGSVCLPYDIISFDCLYPALDRVMENFADTNS